MKYNFLYVKISCVNALCYADGSLLYERVPNKPEVDRLTLTPPQPQSVIPTQQNILKRARAFDEVNGSDGKFHNLFHILD
jgi:hypothetical protein